MSMTSRPPVLLALAAALAAVSLLGLSGCDDACNPALDPGCAGVTPGKPVVRTCTPTAGERGVDETCGTFVSVSKRPSDPEEANQPGAGRKSNPFSRLSDAIAQARKDGRPIYACAEVFEEAVRVPEGVTIYGGMNCFSDEWSYPYVTKSGATLKTTIAPPAGKIPVKFVANPAAAPLPDGGRPPARVVDVAIIAADEATPGASSIAATAEELRVELVRTQLFAGRGGPGAPGQTPTGPVGPLEDPGDPAIAGNAGAVACMGGGMGNPGAAEKGNALCPESIGGAGGRGVVDNGEQGQPGLPAASGFGGGGIGAQGSNLCKNGAIGRPGVLGAHGPGASAMDLGVISLTGYEGVAGKVGATGSPGQGGGGGGGAKGSMECFGASGGSGGAGGCGGVGGGGGLAGGSSIALISLGATLVLADVSFVTGQGGPGGSGAGGQFGGIGGRGGSGGTAGAGLLSACSGGDGGPGGAGGVGGGGRGGHSIGIAYMGIAPAMEGATFTIGSPGEGGAGGDEQGKGAAGAAAEAQAFELASK